MASGRRFRSKLADAGLCRAATLAKIEALASRKDIAEVLEATIKEKAVEAAIGQYRELKSTQPDSYDFENVYALSGLGGRLLRREKIQRGDPNL